MSTLVYVVCTRPYAEKVVGGFISTIQAALSQVDGTFFLDYESARKASMALNRRDSTEKPCWWVYPTLIDVNPACADCGGAMAHHDDPDEHSLCKEFKLPKLAEQTAEITKDGSRRKTFDEHECNKDAYGSVMRNMGGTGAPHPWELTLDAEFTEIMFCPFCGKKLPV